MARYRKRPVVIEAFQWQGDFDALDAWLTSLSYHEDGSDCGGADGLYEASVRCGADHERVLNIPTLEGEMTARQGDWIIRGVNGEFYPVKDDIFQQTYEPAGEED